MSLRNKATLLLLAALLTQTVVAQEGDGTPVKPAPDPKAAGAATAASFAADDDNLVGDRLKLDVIVKGFIPFGSSSGTSRCAPQGSTVIVTQAGADQFSVRVKLPPTRAQTAAEGRTDAEKCLAADYVRDDVQYLISKADLDRRSYRRRGVTFGGLAVPFKYYTGGDKKVLPSSTIAPYVGWRIPGPYSLTTAPIISAGLGLVPVNDANTGKTDTKSAFSTAVGLRLTSDKNQRFSAGVLVGKDFLSKGDRAADKTVDKIWISLYAGIAL